MSNQGIFISLEGVDGSGKTTLKKHLLERLAGHHKILSIREPGGTKISEKIRLLLLDTANSDMLPRTEALLYAAARAQLIEEQIWPALQDGMMVIADRYTDSTLAYQGYGRGLDIDFLNQLNHLSTGGLEPDLTLLLDIDPQQGQLRRPNNNKDRLERAGLDFLNKVRKGYLAIAATKKRIKVLNAAKSENDLLSEALALIMGMQLDEN
jgi:dTMP kinase